MTYIENFLGTLNSNLILLIRAEMTGIGQQILIFKFQSDSINTATAHAMQ